MKFGGVKKAFQKVASHNFKKDINKVGSKIKSVDQAFSAKNTRKARKLAFNVTSKIEKAAPALRKAKEKSYISGNPYAKKLIGAGLHATHVAGDINKALAPKGKHKR